MYVACMHIISFCYIPTRVSSLPVLLANEILHFWDCNNYSWLTNGAFKWYTHVAQRYLILLWLSYYSYVSIASFLVGFLLWRQKINHQKRSVNQLSLLDAISVMSLLRSNPLIWKRIWWHKPTWILELAKVLKPCNCKYMKYKSHNVTLSSTI